MSLLSVRALKISLVSERKTYSLIEDLSFDLKKGSTLALVGESGSGKTVTALSILGLLPTPPFLPPQGEILYDEKNLLTLPPKAMQKIRGGKIAMIFQDPRSSFNPVYTIGSQLIEVAKVHLKLDERAAATLVASTLAEVHLSSPYELMKAYPHELSGGMLQRSLIALALLTSPDILIADEPTTALDVTLQSEILATLAELKEKRGMSVLLITHDMGVLAEIADEVIVMYAGEKVEETKAKELFDNPSHPYTQALFEARYSRIHCKKKLFSLKGNVPSPMDLPSGCRFHPRCKEMLPCCKEGKVPLFTVPDHEPHTARCHLFDKLLQDKINFETL